MRRRILLFGCLLAFLLPPSLAPAETFEVSVGRANVRAGPGVRYDILSRINRGEKFEILEIRGDWIKIRRLGREGWAHKSLGRVVGATLRSIGVVPSAPARTASAPYGESWAIIIGINEYKRPDMRLQYAVNDARSVTAALRKIGFPEKNIITLLDDEASGAGIRRAFGRLTRRTKENDRVVVFYAGHGVTVDLPGGGEMGYLVPVEGDPNDLVATGLPMSQVRDMARQIPAKHVFFAIDACYSGLMAFRAAPRPQTTIDVGRLTRRRLRQIITAGERDQPVGEEGGYGIFTKRLVEGLLGDADFNPRDGILTANELAAWIYPRVVTASNNQQTPFFGTMEGVGQFVFTAPGIGGVPLAPRPAASASVRPRPPARPETARLGRGDLFVTSAPAGAAIFLDGRDTGKRTPELLAGLAAGGHRIFVKKGEGLGLLREVEVKAGDLANIDLRLKTLQGELYAKVRPFGAVVVVDGRTLGRTPLKVKVPAGGRLVVVRKEGYRTFKGKVRVRYGETTDLTRALRAIPKGTLIVESAPAGARIFIDGNHMGRTPKALRLYARVHRLELKKPLYKSVSTSVRVPPNRSTRVAYVLPGSVIGPEALRQIFRLASEAASSVKRAESRARVLTGIAVAQARAGDRAASRRTFDRAVKEIRGLKDGSSLRSALKDIAKAAVKAGDFTYAKRMARPPLEAYDISDILDDIAIAQAKAGDVAKALATAKTLRSKTAQAGVLSRIAGIQEKAGDRPAALRTYAQALKVAPRRGDSAFFPLPAESIREGMAGLQIRLGDFAGALETAGKLEFADYRVALFLDTAIAQARAGHKTAARRTLARAAALTRDSRNFISPKYHARALARAGETAGRTGDPALARLLFAEALKIARGIPKKSDRFKAIEKIATAQARTGNLSGALDMAKGISDRKARSSALASIAIIQARAGRLARAMDIAKGVSERDERGAAFRVIAKSALKARDFSRAIAAAKMNSALGDWQSRDMALAFAKAGDVTRALEIVKSFKYNETLQTRTIREIAQEQWKAGKRLEARKTFALALETAKTIRFDTSRADAFREIAAALARIGKYERALGVAGTPKEAGARAKALIAIATAQTGNGDKAAARKTLTKALETAKSIKKASYRASALTNIAAVVAGMMK